MDKTSLDFILQNASTKGLIYCSKELNIPYKKLYGYCVRHKIDFKRKAYKYNLYSELTPLINIDSPETAYTLGFLQGDGSINKKSTKTSIGIVETDGLELEPIFNLNNEWNTCLYTPKNINWKRQITFYSNSKFIYNFLDENGYSIKTGGSANLILSKIKDELKPFWFRGYSDADGCFYYHKKQSLFQYQITSCFDQEWDFMENIFNYLDIPYQIDRRTTIDKLGKPHSRSNIRFQGKFKIQKWGEYLYDSYYKDSIGLLRKYNKYLNCISSINK